MRTIWLVVFLYSVRVLGITEQERKMQLEMLKNEQLNQRAIDDMRARDINLQALDRALRGMLDYASKKRDQNKLRINEVVKKIQVGAVKIDLTIYKLTQKYRFTLSKGPIGQRYSCFYSKDQNNNRTFHAMAVNQNSTEQVTFDVTSLGKENMKLLIFFKGRGMEGSFEIPKGSYYFAKNFIRVNKVVENKELKLTLREAQLDYSNCAEVNLQEASRDLPPGEQFQGF